VDGKIYVTRSPNANPFLSVIANPNNPGLSCLYLDNFISLNGHEPSYGLPNFIDSYDYTNTVNGCAVQAFFIAPHYLCQGTCTSFLNASQNATSYQWYFPGASPSSSTDEHPSMICYNTPGNYDVTLIAISATGNDTVTLPNYITVYPQPAPQSINQSGDTLFALPGATSYQWYFNGSMITGATNYYYIAPSSGNYNVVATDNNGCEVEAAILNVIAALPSTVDRGPLTVFPNPVTESLSVTGYLLNEISGAAVSIYNLMGEKIYVGVLKESATIDCKNFPDGIYFIEIASNYKTFRTRLIKN
jgi:hypothetical protein